MAAFPGGNVACLGFTKVRGVFDSVDTLPQTKAHAYQFFQWANIQVGPAIFPFQVLHLNIPELFYHA